MPYWNRFVNFVSWRKVWLLPNQYLISNKVKQISFKLLQRFSPSKCFLKKLNQTLIFLAHFVNVLQKLCLIYFGSVFTPDCFGKTSVISFAVNYLLILVYIGNRFCLVFPTVLFITLQNLLIC